MARLMVPQKVAPKALRMADQTVRQTEKTVSLMVDQMAGPMAVPLVEVKVVLMGRWAL